MLQTLKKMTAVKIVIKVDNWLEEIHFADLVKDDKSVAGLVSLLSTDFESNRMMSHKHNLAAMYSLNQNGGLQSQILGFFRITGLLNAEILLSGKAECLLAIDEDKKSKPSRVTFSFNNMYSGPSGESLS